MTAVSRGDIIDMLNCFNEQYRSQEQQEPREGYLVQFGVKDDGIAASLHPCGPVRSSQLLSGISSVRDSCLFCPHNLSRNPLRMNNVAQRITTDAVKSLSGQLLIVPRQHYSQWFDAPVELQADLLQEAIELRAKHPESQKRPIELHCGEAAGQTVFHIHVRTNIFV